MSFEMLFSIELFDNTLPLKVRLIGREPATVKQVEQSLLVFLFPHRLKVKGRPRIDIKGAFFCAF
jgi:hypothetical protein